MTATLSVTNLTVSIPTRQGVLTAVDGLSFEIAPGEVLGVVGESGAGKSITGSAIVGLLEPPGRVTAGEVRLAGERIDNLPAEMMRRVRGKRIGMIFQDPLTSLNPLYRIGDQLVETILTHEDISRAAAWEKARRLLQEVGISAADERLSSFPHQFSGGMRQRVVIALALAAEPELVIADEPTTALDVSMQAQIISLLKRLCAERGASVMLVTHDMGVVAETVDRVCVLYAGRLVEIGPVEDVVNRPQHPYTQGLMAAIPKLAGNSGETLRQIRGSMPRLAAIPAGCAFNPRCDHAFARCITERPQPRSVGESAVSCFLHDPGSVGVRPLPNFAAAAGGGYRGGIRDRRTAPPDRRRELDPAAGDEVLVEAHELGQVFDLSRPWLSRLIERKGRVRLTAVDGVSFSIMRGETYALVGESGSGKSTIAKMVAGLLSPTSGAVTIAGTEGLGDGLHDRRGRIQMIFQDPFASLNPRWRVEAIIAEPIKAFDLAGSAADRRSRVGELLSLVGLDPSDGRKFPHEFSGGQRQRIAIARALASEPEFIVCDEPTSALDVSVQAQVLNLLRDLQQRLGLTYLFISHNLAVVRHIADRVGVLYLGRLVEEQPAHALFSASRHPYTRMLLAAVPDIERRSGDRQGIAGEIPNPINPPAGCHFHPRCSQAIEHCSSFVPPDIFIGQSRVRCLNPEGVKIDDC